jgi:hypothetical protein
MNGGHDMILADSPNSSVRLGALVPGAGIEPTWLKPADFKGAALPSLIKVLAVLCPPKPRWITPYSSTHPAARADRSLSLWCLGA